MAEARRRGRPVDGAGLRARLARELPGRIQAALTAYEAFAGADPPADAKAFAAHHAACKAALAHADMLVRLLKWAEGAAAGPEDRGDDVAALLARARAALGPDPEAPGREDSDQGDMEDDDPA